MSETLLAFYDDAYRWVAQEWPEDLEYIKNLRPESIDPRRFFEEYLHVVLVSGFRWSIVNKLYDAGLWLALKEGDHRAVAADRVGARLEASEQPKEDRCHHWYGNMANGRQELGASKGRPEGEQPQFFPPVPVHWPDHPVPSCTKHRAGLRQAR